MKRLDTPGLDKRVLVKYIIGHFLLDIFDKKFVVKTVSLQMFCFVRQGYKEPLQKNLNNEERSLNPGCHLQKYLRNLLHKLSIFLRQQIRDFSNGHVNVQLRDKLS